MAALTAAGTAPCGRAQGWLHPAHRASSATATGAERRMGPIGERASHRGACLFVSNLVAGLDTPRHTSTQSTSRVSMDTAPRHRLDTLSPLSRHARPTLRSALLAAVRSRRSGLAVHPRRVLHGPAAPDWRGEIRVGTSGGTLSYHFACRGERIIRGPGHQVDFLLSLVSQGATRPTTHDGGARRAPQQRQRRD